MKVFYIFLLIIFPSLIFAQSNYHAGYVLKNNGDTIKGYIDYREWVFNPDAINFKTSIDDKQPITFNPETIKKFQINDFETFISYTGKVSMNRNHFPNLAEGPDTSEVYTTIFLQQIATGKYITLYNYTDGTKALYFIAEANNAPVELKYDQYYDDNGNVVDHFLYRGQLLLLVNKLNISNPQLLKEIANLNFEQPALVNITGKINQDSLGMQNRNENSLPGSRLFAGADLNLTGVTISGVSSNRSQSVRPAFNFGIDIFNNKNVQQFIFRTELSVSFYSVNIGFISSDQPTIKQTLTYSEITASLIPQAIFNVYNKDKLKVYLDGGLSINVTSFSPKNEFNAVGGNFLMQSGVVFNKKLEVLIGFSPYTPQAGAATVHVEHLYAGVKYLFGNN